MVPSGTRFTSSPEHGVSLASITRFWGTGQIPPSIVCLQGRAKQSSGSAPAGFCQERNGGLGGREGVGRNPVTCSMWHIGQAAQMSAKRVRAVHVAEMSGPAEVTSLGFGCLSSEDHGN